ncbi:Peptidyl-tRNA hydrolase [Corynebacterium choanae]|uniref:Peptidyl-tRNA hydrolase n=1 Tax=Corynebacterium choanae TaxID=1862358 RepID=A0A3G6J8B0_9CORY|nr:Peptidyl-tRNA hydrolase [Corynebacterium choanae]
MVGLGNPGERYATTRHNIGFMVADELVDQAVPMPGTFKLQKRAGAEVAEIRIGVHKVVVAKPMSFMNRSGQPVASLCQFFKIPADHVIVVHDELDVEFGSIKLKCGGGDGGHNGLKSISQSLSTRDYYRVRVGISRPPGRQDPADYVLRPFPSAAAAELSVTVADAADAVELLITQGLQVAQNEIHAR